MEKFKFKQLKELLDQKYAEYNNKSFIDTDPIQIPHRFEQKENIEISAFLSSTIAWGQRKSIINNSKKMMAVMDNNPIEYLKNVSDKEIEKIRDITHRTFNYIDFQFFIKSLKNIYTNYGGLEKVFTDGYKKNNTIKEAIRYFREIFFSIPFLERTSRHIANVEKNSAAKRINLLLMWMVRKDNSGVHFGLWNKIPTSSLMLPIDIHTGNTARALGLLNRKQNDWKAVEEVTSSLREFDPIDPVKYDFSLFGIDLNKK
jgi:uncharacterized protein (TIGR02757 family)